MVDGRRLSTIPARAIGDQRLMLGHLRLLGRLGMHIDREGWCRVRQAVLGETIGMARETVNRRLKDLVEWQYVATWSDDASGRSIFYRVLLDTPGKPTPADIDGPDELGPVPDNPSHANDAELPLALASSPMRVPEAAKRASGPVTPTSHVAQARAPELYPTCDPHVTSGVTAGDHTRCDVQASHITSSSTGYSTQDSPPNPRSRGNRGRGIDLVLETVRRADPGRARPVDKLLGPLCRQRTLTAPDVPYALGVLADWGKLRDLDDDGMAAVLERLKDERKAMVKPADVEAAVKDEAPRSEARSRRSAAVAAQQAACPPEVAATWKRVRAALAQTFGQAVFDAWFAEVVAIGLADGRLTLATPSAIHVRYINQNYTSGLVRVAQSAAPDIRTVELIVLATPHAGMAA